MKILIISIGRKNDSAIEEIVNDFTNRISHYMSIEWHTLSPKSSIREEGEAVIKVLKEKDYLIVLDEKGIRVGSPVFANIIKKATLASPQRLVFLIGGAYGIDDMVKAKAKKVISLSDLTFPHQLVRIILVEQIY